MARFRTECQVMVSTEAGGEGRNLQFCHRLVNFDLPWNPMRVEQRIGRLHRLGQSRDVWILNCCTQGTIEAHVLHLLDQKIGLFRQVFGELDVILASLEEDFERSVGELVLSSRDERELAERLEALGARVAEARQRYEEAHAYVARVLGEEVDPGTGTDEGGNGP